MPRYIITARCSRNHVQELTVEQFNEADAYQFAKILDGTSDLFITRQLSSHDSVIGKCGVCGAGFTCTVRPD